VTTTRKLTELFRALAADDLGGATSAAAQLIKLEEKKGNTTVARTLRGALSAGSVPSSDLGARVERPVEGVLPLSTALVRLSSERRLSDVVLSNTARTALNDLIAEWHHREVLVAKGLPRRSKLIFHGPPGCGKSLSAQALGNELRLPVYMVRFDAVIGAFLGQTAMHLRQLFVFAEATPCILLLDELDALGKRRGNPLDVGELDRIVISLMQELEHSRPRGFVIGTTNLPRHLDDALWRRFDLDVSFKTPSQATLKAFVTEIARANATPIRPALVSRAARTRSFAAAERIVLDEIRKQAIAGLKGK
jgi:AAA+ superfamily predicted ATPase